jgi:MFS family permease
MHDGKLAVGVVVGCFAVSAVLTRPAAGRLGNRAGRRWLMLVGAAVVGCSFAAYSLTTNLALVIILRLVTGVGEGLFYTGSATIIADLAPPGRVGEAISLYSASIWIGTGIGPVVGQSVYHLWGSRVGFDVAAALSVIAVLLSLKVPNLKSMPAGAATRQPLVARRALAPGGVVALGVTGTVAFYAYLPLYAEAIHLSSVQYVYLLYAVVVWDSCWFCTNL